MPDQPDLMMIRAVNALFNAGMKVERVGDFQSPLLPGLYRVNGGPELTERQVIDMASQAGLL